MAFNSNSYNRNMHLRGREADMAEARAIKIELAAGDIAGVGETRLRQLVRSAKLNNRLYLMYRRFGRMH